MTTLATMAWDQLWQATAVALAVGTIAWLVGRRRPHLAYILWLLVLVKFLTPPLWSSPLGVFSWAGGKVGERSEASVQPATSISSSQPSSASAEIVGVPSNDIGPGPLELPPAVSDASKPLPVTAMSAETEQPYVPRPDGFPARGLLAVVWLAGAVMYLVIVTMRMARWKSALRRSQLSGDGPLNDLLARLSAQLGVRRKVIVRVSSEQVGPAVVGLVRPTILLPETLVSNRSLAQLEPIVAHELIHIRRRDAAVGALQVVAQCLWWFHPLVWWTNLALCRQRERCCDAEVVGSLDYPRERYAQGLLDVLRLERQLTPAASMPGMSPYQITRIRLEGVMNPKIRIHGRTPLVYWAIFAAGMLVALPGAVGIRGEETPAPPPATASSTAESGLIAPAPSVKPVQTLSGHTAAVRSVAFSPDGKTLASAGLNGTIRLWQMPEGKERATLNPEPPAEDVIAVNTLAFAPDGKLLASGGSDGLVRLWDPATGKQVRTIQAIEGPVFCVAFSPDGRQLASAGADRSIRLWDPATGEPVPDGVLRHGASVRGITFGSDAKTIASIADGGTLKIFQLQPPKESAKLSNWTEVRSLARSPDDRTIAIGLGRGEAITLWTHTGDKELQRYILGGHRYGTNALAFSPDSNLLASAGSDGRIKLWDMNTKSMLAQVKADEAAELTVAFSPDGTKLASAGTDHKIRLWSVDQLKTLPQEKPKFPKIIEPPRFVRLNHAEEPRLVGVMKRLGAVFLAKGARPTWSPDATRIAYVTMPKSELHIIDLVSGKVQSLGEIGRDPAWSPKPGRWIAYVSGRQVAHFGGPSEPETPRGNEEVRLIDSSGGESRKIADGYAPAWSADAKTLYFVSGEDQEVKSVEIKPDGSPGAIKSLFTPAMPIRYLAAAISPVTQRVAYVEKKRLVVADGEGDKTMPTWTTQLEDNWLLGWSPDGKMLGGTTVWGCSGLVFLDQATGRAVRVGTGEMFAPAWSRDGSMIAFDANLVDGCEIWMLDANVLAARNPAQPPYRPEKPAGRFDLAVPFQPEGELTCVDLQPNANQRMDLPTFDLPHNDMRQVPHGEQTLGGAKFTVGPGSLQLGSGLLPEAPERIEGIQVGKQAARIYVIQGSQFSGPAHNVADGTTIGFYRIVFEDQTEQVIAIVAGEDVRSWYVANDPEAPSRDTKVWEGENLLAKWRKTSVQLFAGGWTNPHPEKKISRIDYIAAGTQAAPFCLAITIEAPVSK